MTIGLYNTYEKRSLREPHRRAIARAATIAEAFDWNLAIFGFAFPPELSTSQKIAEWLATTTSIGDSGRYTIELSDSGRMNIFDLPRKGFPPQLGIPVATTRKPWAEKSITAEEIAERVLAGESFLFLFGLGPKGLPSTQFKLAEYHFDVTGIGKSLETCTALGAVVASVNMAIKMLEKAPG